MSGLLYYDSAMTMSIYNGEFFASRCRVGRFVCVSCGEDGTKGLGFALFGAGIGHVFETWDENFEGSGFGHWGLHV